MSYLLLFFPRGAVGFLNVTFFFAGTFFFLRFSSTSRTAACWTTYKNKHTKVKEKYNNKQYTSIFTTRKNFNFHVKIIHEETFIFSCDKCDKTFTIFKNLNHHTKKKHFKCNKNLNIANMGNFDCNECDKTFKRKKLLKRHKKGEETHDSHRTLFSAVATFFFWTRIIKIDEDSTNGWLQDILRPFCSQFIFYVHFWPKTTLFTKIYLLWLFYNI